MEWLHVIPISLQMRNMNTKTKYQANSALTLSIKYSVLDISKLLLSVKYFVKQFV